MLRVWRVSGEELHTVPVDELSDVATLKRQLRSKHGFPVCFQQLLHESRRLAEDEKLDAAVDVQLIISPLVEGADGMEELLEAVETGDAQLARALLDAGVPTDCRNEGGDTALMRACDSGNVEVVRFLLEAGAATDLINTYDRSLGSRVVPFTLFLVVGSLIK